MHLIRRGFGADQRLDGKRGGLIVACEGYIPLKAIINIYFSGLQIATKRLVTCVKQVPLM